MHEQTGWLVTYASAPSFEQQYKPVLLSCACISGGRAKKSIALPESKTCVCLILYLLV